MGPKTARIYSTRVGHSGINEFAVGFIIQHELDATDGVITAIYDWDRGDLLRDYVVHVRDKDSIEVRCPVGIAAPKGGLRVVVVG